MTPEDQAKNIIGRWRPYMKVFGPNKAFPKNDVCMQDDIAAEIRKAYDRGFLDCQKESIEWCMAFRRDDGTAQKIEEKIRALKPERERDAI